MSIAFQPPPRVHTGTNNSRKAPHVNVQEWPWVPWTAPTNLTHDVSSEDSISNFARVLISQESESWARYWIWIDWSLFVIMIGSLGGAAALMVTALLIS